VERHSSGAGCLALVPAIRISARQVELLCGGPEHVDCPRFIHGGAGERPVLPPPVRGGPARAPLPVAASSGTTSASEAGSSAPFGATRPTPEPAPVAPGVLAAGIPDPSAAAAPVALVDPVDPVTPVALVPPLVPPAPPLVPVVEAPTTPGTDRSGSLFGSSETSRPVGGANTAFGRARRALTRGSQAHERSVVLRPATAIASLLLVAAILIALSFVAARGGLTLPSTSPTSSGLGAGAIGSAAPSSIGGSPVASASGAPLGSAGGFPSAVASASSPPDSGQIGSPAPSASPDRLALLTPCPGVSDCYHYRIVAGDTLSSVAKFFAVPLATIRKLNPQIANPSLIHVGQIITLPTPGG
jgi:hypothetical protein